MFITVFSPPRLSAERQRGIVALAERAARALECEGLVEVDVIVSDLGNEQIIEVDALPALSPDSMVGRIARSRGTSFSALCERVLAMRGCTRPIAGAARSAIAASRWRSASRPTASSAAPTWPRTST